VPENATVPPIVFPLLVIVFPVDVALNVKEIADEKVVLEARNKLPEIVIDGVAPPKNVPPETEIVRSRQTADETAIPTNDPEFESKKTESAAVGTDAPPAPPDVVAQLRVFVVFQEDAPPTQYRFATIHLPFKPTRGNAI
jgi:hypothetical protein